MTCNFTFGKSPIQHYVVLKDHVQKDVEKRITNALNDGMKLARERQIAHYWRVLFSFLLRICLAFYSLNGILGLLLGFITFFLPLWTFIEIILGIVFCSSEMNTLHQICEEIHLMFKKEDL